MGKNIYLWPFKFCIFCIFALHVSWARPFVASQSDHYRRLFSGTLGMLPVVLPNQHLPVTIVHFLWYSPLYISWVPPVHSNTVFTVSMMYGQEATQLRHSWLHYNSGGVRPLYGASSSTTHPSPVQSCWLLVQQHKNTSQSIQFSLEAEICEHHKAKRKPSTVVAVFSVLPSASPSPPLSCTQRGAARFH